MKKLLVDFAKNEEGLTMVEYAIAGTLVVTGAIVAFTTLGTNVAGRITDLAGYVGTGS